MSCHLNTDWIFVVLVAGRVMIAIESMYLAHTTHIDRAFQHIIARSKNILFRSWIFYDWFFLEFFFSASFAIAYEFNFSVGMIFECTCVYMLRPCAMCYVQIWSFDVTIGRARARAVVMLSLLLNARVNWKVSTERKSGRGKKIIHWKANNIIHVMRVMEFYTDSNDDDDALRNPIYPKMYRWLWTERCSVWKEKEKREKQNIY